MQRFIVILQFFINLYAILADIRRLSRFPSRNGWKGRRKRKKFRSGSITRSNFCSLGKPRAKWRRALILITKYARLICTFILMEKRRMRCSADRPLPRARRRLPPIFLIISTETREMPRAFLPFYLLGPLYVCAFRLVLPAEWDVPRWKETSVTHYPRNAREKLLRSFSPPPFQRFNKLRVLSKFYIYIYIYKEDAWKDAVKYQEPDKNIDSLIRLFHARVSRINQNLKKKYFFLER